VRNNVAAYISNADKNSTLATDFGVTFGGTLTVQATEHATITATAVAASIAAGFSKGGALALSGAGAESTNVILTNTNAYIQDSRIEGTGTGGVTVSANNDSRITATIVGASLAVGAGKDNGVGVSIGAALASNFIGWDPKAGSSQGVGQTQAFVTDSSMIISGALSATATATQVVNATVVAASAAFSGGKELGVSLAGAGADSLNQVANTVQAYIDGDTSGGIHAGSVSVIADDTSTITAVTVGATLAAAFSGQTGVALAVGVSLAANIITSQIAAYIKDADDIDSAFSFFVIAKNRAAIHSV
jgi:hypothetical protein